MAKKIAGKKPAPVKLTHKDAVWFRAQYNDYYTELRRLQSILRVFCDELKGGGGLTGALLANELRERIKGS